MHLYLIRHGESATNLPDWDGAGIANVSLTPKGQEQAAALGAWLPNNILRPDVLYSSTLIRTRETSAHVAKALAIEPIFDERLQEIGNNARDHSPLDDYTGLEYPQYWSSEKPYASSNSMINGETLLHFRARLGMFLHDAVEKHQGKVIVVVCHGFVIDTFVDLIYDIGAHRRVEVWTSNTGICHFQYVEHPGREHWRLHYLNRIEHLQGVGALGLTAGGSQESWQE